MVRAYLRGHPMLAENTSRVGRGYLSLLDDGKNVLPLKSGHRQVDIVSLAWRFCKINTDPSSFPVL